MAAKLWWYFMFALRGAKLNALEQHLLRRGVANMTEDKGTVSKLSFILFQELSFQ